MGVRLNVLIGAAIILAANGCVFPKRLAKENPFRSEVVGFIEPGAILPQASFREELTQRLIVTLGGCQYIPELTRGFEGALSSSAGR